VGFLSRLFGRGVEPGLTHGTELGITEGLGRGHQDLGTYEGNPSVVDSLDGALGAGAAAPVADAAVDADLAVDMESDTQHLEESEEDVWDAIGADPHDVDGVLPHPRPGEGAIDADLDTYETDLTERRDGLRGPPSP